MVNILTVIPARSGSKSIPNKNIRILNKLPLLAHSIQYSLKSKLVTKTIVSTDSPMYAKIAVDHGAEVPFIRPAHLSSDDVQDFPVIHHALIQSEEVYKTTFDFVVLLRPTSPLRPHSLIEKGIELLINNKIASSLRSVIESEEHPYRQWQQNGSFISGFFPDISESYNLPRQKLPKSYFQSGDIEIIRRDTIMSGSISGNFVIPLIIEKSQMFDIDYESDFQDAERVVRGKE